MRKQGKLATKGFGVDQVWAQLAHYTEKANQQAINNLNALVSSEDFLRALDQIGSDAEDEEAMTEEIDEEPEEEPEEDLEEEGEAEIDELPDSNSEDIEEYLDDQDSEEDQKD